MSRQMAESYASRVDGSGRLLIPAKLRRQLGLEAGTHVALEADSAGMLSVRPRRAAVRAAQAYFGRLRGNKLWSEELIADRRAEAKREHGG